MEGTGSSSVVILFDENGYQWGDYMVQLLKAKQTCLRCRKISLDGTPLSRGDSSAIGTASCRLLILTDGLMEGLTDWPMTRDLLKLLVPPKSVLLLLCGVSEEDAQGLLAALHVSHRWTILSCESAPESFVATITDIVTEGGTADELDSGMDSKTDTDTDTAAGDAGESSASPRGNATLVLPSRIMCGQQMELHVLLRKELEEQPSLTCRFMHKNQPALQVPAKRVNPYTLRCTAPDLPPGIVQVAVCSAGAVRESTSLTYYTALQEVGDILGDVNNPIAFMCQAFKIEPHDPERLDMLLADSLRENLPASNLHLFGNHQLSNNNTQREEELPTLMHFAAKHGLRNLTALLFQCPGAVQAYSVANRSGLYPNNLAEQHGFQDLRKFMDDYVEAIIDENESEYMAMTPSRVAPTPAPEDEEPYIAMGPGITVKQKSLRALGRERACCGVPLPSDPFGLFGLTHSDASLRNLLEGTTEEMQSGPPKARPANTEERSQQNLPKRASLKPTRSPPAVAQHQPEKGFEDASANQDPTRDHFAGMKTPGQQQLITLQEQVKAGLISIDEAVIRFKANQIDEKRRMASFKFHEENLKSIRESIARRKKEPSPRQPDLKEDIPVGLYESLPSKEFPFPSQGAFRHRPMRDSTSSTTSSVSSRSSTRSLQSLSSGAEADIEVTDILTSQASEGDGEGDMPHTMKEKRRTSEPPMLEKKCVPPLPVGSKKMSSTSPTATAPSYPRPHSGSMTLQPPQIQHKAPPVTPRPPHTLSAKGREAPAAAGASPQPGGTPPPLLPRGKSPQSPRQ
ncbi:phosphoinositide 3-kinase adapter protein 1-like isoform X1 [Lethenteron reissneri]|uniref:phosphoinositide 3-kinase adapter protein 1-like isoform X1 n=1 Tax=Lethenteron reissneri TaxID=7753 RepID=UPI002AB645E7|nr:phosphoinositide 3-kinase adapter protein 1-like isoform X1 [Lethenteron reissneri]